VPIDLLTIEVSVNFSAETCCAIFFPFALAGFEDFSWNNRKRPVFPQKILPSSKHANPARLLNLTF
jgi:hypothetical protein